MNDADLIAALRGADDVLRATDPATLDLPVPTCLGRTVADLIGHMSGVQRWARGIVLAPTGERVRRPVDDLPTGAALIEYFADGADALVETFTTADLDREVDAFVGPRPARWWLRRQTHEAVIHAWDRQRATGEKLMALDPAVASDGIDELLGLLVDPRSVDTEVFAVDGESIHVHATDVEGEWMVRLAPGSIVITREHAKGDLALRGPAADLLAVLSSRSPIEGTGIETFGSLDLLDRYRASATM